MNEMRLRKKSFAFRLFSLFVLSVFVVNSLITPVQAQLISNLPKPGEMVKPSPAFKPALMLGVKPSPENPFLFDFIMTRGDEKLQGADFEQESTRLIKYFLAAVTIPDSESWVNLSPYEQDRIIPEALSATEMGRDMLAQDYILKQFSASLTNPHEKLGETFWSNVYAKAREKFGTSQIPINTFNKVWIVPDVATVLEQNGTAFVAESHLKVMLEGDYVSLKENLNSKKFGTEGMDQQQAEQLSDISSAIVKEIIIPELEREVNEGKNFAPVRQIYNSVILAVWYKKTLKDSLLGRVYMDQKKIVGVDALEKDAKEQIYAQYIEAFRRGVYNLIKKDNDPAVGRITRKYFSGGVDIQKETAKILNTSVVLTPEIRESMMRLAGYVSPEGAVALAGTVVQRVQLVESPERGVVVAGAQASGDIRDLDAGTIAQRVGEVAQKFSLTEAQGKFVLQKFSEIQGQLAMGRPSTVPLDDPNRARNLSELSPEELAQYNIFLASRTVAPNREQLREAAKGARARFLAMMAGIGESHERLLQLYALHAAGKIKRLLVDGKPVLAAKNQDSYMTSLEPGYDSQGQPISVEVTYSIFEMQLMQAVKAHQKGKYASLGFGSSSNQHAINELNFFLDNEIFLEDRIDGRIPQDQKRTWRSALTEMGIDPMPPMMNPALPHVNLRDGTMMAGTEGSGGHGMMGYSLFIDMAEEAVPAEQEILVVFNGDGPNNGVIADSEFVGFKVAHPEAGPVTVLAMPKTDPKEKIGLFYLTLVGDQWVLASKELGQIQPGTSEMELFTKLGFREGRDKILAIGNTNSFVMDRQSLIRFLNDLENEIGAEEYSRIISPDLGLAIKDVKGQKAGKYEGAFLSVLLKLNQFVLTDPRGKKLLEKYGWKMLINLMVLDEGIDFAKKQRERPPQFTPVKNSADLWVLKLAKRSRNSMYQRTEDWNLEKVQPGVPLFDLAGYYKEQQRIDTALGLGADVSGLNQLTVRVEGANPLWGVLIPDATWRGDPEIISDYQGVFDLALWNETSQGIPMEDGHPVIDNLRITISAQGEVTIQNKSLQGAAVVEAGRSPGEALGERLLRLQKAVAVLELEVKQSLPSDESAVNLWTAINESVVGGLLSLSPSEQVGFSNWAGVRKFFDDRGEMTEDIDQVIAKAEAQQQFTTSRFFMNFNIYVNARLRFNPIDAARARMDLDQAATEVGENAVQMLLQLEGDGWSYNPDNRQWQKSQPQQPVQSPLQQANAGQGDAEEDTYQPAAVSEDVRPGGIDFDPSFLNLQIKRDGRGVPLPLPEQNLENIHIDGLYPVIINISPATIQNFPFLIGAEEPKPEDKLSLVAQ